MKKYFRIVVAVWTAVALCTSAAAAKAAEEGADYTIIVNDQVLDLRDLPSPPYKEGGTVMVPLRKIGEALGYKVAWNPESQTILMDDEYIQKAALHDGTAAVIFGGRLQVIDLSREVEYPVKTVIHRGYTYVPMELFSEFLNDIIVEDMIIKIAPSRSELHHTDLGS